MPRRLLVVLALLTAAVALLGCGGGEAEQVVEDARTRVREVREDVRKEAREARERVRRRVQEILDDLEKAVPEAQPDTPVPTARGNDDAETIDEFLTKVIGRVDRYWTRTLAANDLPEPRVSYVWVPPNRRVRSACGEPAGDESAFYCPADDTIYIGQVLAAELYQGLARGFPGQEAGQGRAAGDFGVAYIVAHEYAHNVQAELGFFELGRQNGSKPFELQADCMAGLWANSVYQEGDLSEEDVQEAMSTAEAVGDFDYDNVNHHGTPAERRAAWTDGFRSGSPANCQRYVPT